jgi:hypothetical protein
VDESTLFPSLLWTSLEACVHFVSSILFFAAVLNYNFFWEEYHHLRFSSSLFSLLNVFVLESRLYERTVPVQSVVFQFRQVGRNVLEALGCSLTASWYGEFLENMFWNSFLAPSETNGGLSVTRLRMSCELIVHKSQEYVWWCGVTDAEHVRVHHGWYSKYRWDVTVSLRWLRCRWMKRIDGSDVAALFALVDLSIRMPRVEMHAFDVTEYIGTSWIANFYLK